MPARRLGSSISAVSRYDVVGQDSHAVSEFVCHVALADEDRADVTGYTEVAPTHMGPPLEVGGDAILIESLGTVPLTTDQQYQVQSFIVELSSEYAAKRALDDWRQYVVVPDMTEPDDKTSCHRFSCAGFVLRAYREAGIELLNRNLDALPSVELEVLIQSYPDKENELRRPLIRRRLGLDGDGPWPAVLAGYVMNALNRETDQIRAVSHLAQSGDEFFPARRNREEGETEGK